MNSALHLKPGILGDSGLPIFSRIDMCVYLDFRFAKLKWIKRLFHLGATNTLKENWTVSCLEIETRGMNG